MKIYSFTIILITYSYFAFSQGGVGINETGSAPDASAILDISSSNKGLLIPRLSLTDTTDVTTINGATTSLIVHNTNDTMQGGNGTGLYQWNGSKWIKLIAPENGPGSSGQVLTSQGTGKAAAWKTGGGGSSSSCVEWAGYTTSSYDGNMSTGTKGMMSKCHTDYPGSHPCIYEEIIMLGNDYPFSSTAWVVDGNDGRQTKDGAEDTNSDSGWNCLVWQTNSSSSIYRGVVMNTNGIMNIVRCNSSYKIPCCK